MLSAGVTSKTHCSRQALTLLAMLPHVAHSAHRLEHPLTAIVTKQAAGGRSPACLACAKQT